MDTVKSNSTPAAVGLQQLVRWRWPLLVTVALAATILAGGRGDWDFFVDSARGMFGADGLSVYALRRDIQTGPITLVIARLLALTPRNGFVLAGAACCALGLYSVRIAERIGNRSTRPQLSNQLLALIGGVCLLAWWGQFSGFGHLDDAIVLAIAATVVEKRLAGSDRWSPLLVGLAIATKPWAIFLLPLLLPVNRLHGEVAGFRRLLRVIAMPAVALGVAAVCWLPFIVADAGTFDGVRPTVKLAPNSTLALFVSNTAVIPTWLRAAQLLAVMLLGLLLVRRGRAVALLLGCVAVRLMTDPGTWAYYTPGFLLGALLLDARFSRTARPSVTLVAAVLLVPASLTPSDTAGAVMRLVACLGAVIIAWSWPAMPSSEPVSNGQLQPLTV